MNRKTLLSNLEKEVICYVCNNALIYWSKHAATLQTTMVLQHAKNVEECLELLELPTNFRINGFFDVLASKESNTAAVQCGNCTWQELEELPVFLPIIVFHPIMKIEN